MFLPTVSEYSHLHREAGAQRPLDLSVGHRAHFRSSFTQILRHEAAWVRLSRWHEDSPRSRIPTDPRLPPTPHARARANGQHGARDADACLYLLARDRVNVSSLPLPLVSFDIVSPPARRLCLCGHSVTFCRTLH